MSNITGDMLRGHLETMVLAGLESGPAHGYQIVRRLDAAGCGAFRLKEGTVYPVLYRLQERGLIQAEWEDTENERPGPRRRYYRLTREGRKQLDEGRATWQRFVNVMGPIMEGSS